ncbi:hypothetical protein ACTI_69410 [Actinoplanes sp. OR16]|uniref:hypothetical protein n=1 Tax=Actinoplanes sp. OR16 TaxID=946334 RepID=UPI000F70BECA|nr:hypothetical protein [Actinoplanes sp. OR16]BBH70256.1 hypothetical protein ACTI_69410 [Actinoplanes sp. OR16]
MSRSWLILWAAAMVAAAAGCAAGEQADRAPVSASSSEASAYYTGLSGECPTLTSPESARFTGSRTAEGIRSPKQSDSERIDCGWRPSSGAPPWVVVALTIHHGPDTARQAAEQHFNQDRAYDTSRADFSSAIRATERTTPSGPAYAVANASRSGADELSQTTLVGNVVVVVILFVKPDPGVDGSARAADLLTDLAATSDAITAEIAGQLVSQS